MDYENRLFIYKKLNTKEDNFMVHKTLGLFCLCNFIYRYYLLLFYGEMFLENTFGLFSILIHGLLSYSSIIFHIPQVRNQQKPMIYPEFRLHSITFATRSILCCIINYYNLHLFYKFFTIYFTMVIADKITEYYNKGRNNGTTMKGMPFDDNISLEEQRKITFFNSSMQISATIFMLNNMDMCFSPLFGIQIAAFLMTLVRKSLISSRMWHILYSFSLWINFLFYLTPNTSIEFIFIQLIMYYIYKLIIFRNKINKYIGWTFLFILFQFWEELHKDKDAGFIHIEHNTEILIRYFIVLSYLFGVFKKTKSLFL
jgi:hypothetical protein